MLSLEMAIILHFANWVTFTNEASASLSVSFEKCSFCQFKAFLWYPIVECFHLGGVFRYGNLVYPSAIAKLRGNDVTLVIAQTLANHADFVHLRISWRHFWEYSEK